MIIDEDIPIEHRHVDAVLAGLEEVGFQQGIDFEVR
jgi:hypothetical protein